MSEAHPVHDRDPDLAELVGRAREQGQELVLTDAHDEPVAALVPIETWREMQAVQDAADIAICEASRANPAGAMTHEAFMAALDAEDVAAG